MSTALTNTQFERVVLRKESWHFRYYLFIRKFWGLTEPPARTSLCPYSQTIFWFSAGLLIFSPLIIIGWLALKASRLIYKGAAFMGWERFIDGVDNSPVGQWFEKASDQGMKESPGLATATAGIGTVMGIVILTALVAGVGFLGYEFIIHIPDIPWALWEAVKGITWALATVGWGIVNVLGFIGWGLHQMGLGIAWLAKVIFNFLTEPALWSTIGHVLYYSIVTAVIGLVVGVSVWKFSNTKLGIWLYERVIFKLNGYAEAKKKSVERRSTAAYIEAMEAIRQEKQRNPNIFQRGSKKFANGVELIIGVIGNGIGRLFETKIPVGEVATTVLTPLGVACRSIWAFKQGICPIIEFLDDQTIIFTAQIAKECEGQDVLKTSDKHKYLYAYNVVIGEESYRDFRKGEYVRIDPTKQELFKRFLDTEWRKEHGYNEIEPARIRIHMSKYILGLSTLAMLQESLGQDINTLDAMVKEEREKSAKEAESRESARVAAWLAKQPKPEAEVAAPETSNPSVTDTTVAPKPSDDDPNGCG